MMPSAPLVSVIIPAYNGAKELQRAVPMLDRQGYAPFEAVVVDDGSTDHTPQVLEELSQGRPWLQWCRQENGGAGAARNRGVARSHGEFLAFLDCDDLWTEDCLEARMAPFLEEDDPEMLGVYCPAQIANEAGEPLLDGLLFDYVQPHNRLYYSTVMGSLFNPSCVIVRKAAFERVGGFCQEAAPAEDFDLWQRLLRTGGYFFKTNACRVRWVQHPQSTVHTMLRHHNAQCAMVIDRLYTAPAGPASPVALQGVFGEVLARKEETKRAMASLFLAAAAGDMPQAAAAAERVERVFLEQMPLQRLLWLLECNVLAVTGKRNAPWDEAVRPSLLAALELLSKRMGPSRSLAALIAALQAGAAERRGDARHDPKHQ